MKLGVCGCSWMSATQDIKGRVDCEGASGKHFTEILAKKLGWELYSLARSACSNSAIRMQVAEMVQQKVDLVLVGVTSANRIEFPIKGKEFDPSLGVYNIDYKLHPDLSSLNEKFVHDNIVSDTLNNIVRHNEWSHPYKFLTPDHYSAIKSYITYLFDPQYREQQDAWIIHSGIAELRAARIPFFLVMQGWIIPYTPFNDESNPSLIRDDKLWPWTYHDMTTMRRWHTTDESQEVLANNWYTFLKENNVG